MKQYFMGLFFVEGLGSMHIPDNYLSPSTCAVLGIAMVPIWKRSARAVKNEISKSKLPMLGIGAAFSFLLMMLNIPLPGGTTGHAVGGTLIAVLIGPYAACISLSVALLIQALLFGDGGIIAYAANCFNMAFVLPFFGYFIYKFIKDRVASDRGELIGMAIAAYIGLVFAALLTAIEFGIQPLLFTNASGQPLYCPYSLTVSIPAMVLPHVVVVGVVEALFTVSIFAFIKKVSPGTIYESAKKKTMAVFGVLTLLVCLSPLGLLASGTAWGEWGADEISNVIFKGKALGYVPEGMKQGSSVKAIFADYTMKGLPEVVGYILSAVAGVALLTIIFKIAFSIGKNKVWENED